MIPITLFTKDGCSLCDDVKESLALLHASYPHRLREVDITKDVALFNKYRYTIPVLKIADVELAAPITAVQLQNALKNATT